MTSRQQMCGIGTHRLEGAGVPITERKYVKFIKLYNREYRAGWLICEKCVDHVKRSYRFKLKRALAQMRQGVDVSSLQTSSSSIESTDTIDRLILKTPRNPNLTNHSKYQKTSDSDTSDNSKTKNEAPLEKFTLSDSSLTELGSENVRSSQQLQQMDTPKQGTIHNAPPGKVTFAVPNTEANDDFEPSPNALNGTRLPHVQPILKKRKPTINDGFDYQAFVRTADIHGG